MPFRFTPSLQALCGQIPAIHRDCSEAVLQAWLRLTFWPQLIELTSYRLHA